MNIEEHVQKPKYGVLMISIFDLTFWKNSRIIVFLNRFDIPRASIDKHFFFLYVCILIKCRNIHEQKY